MSTQSAATARANRDVGAEAAEHDHVTLVTPSEHAAQDPLGRGGRPFERRSPYFIGLTAALGVLTAVVLYQILSNIGVVLELIGVALFLAIGLDPAVAWLNRRGLPRWVGVVLVVATVLAFVGAFVVAAVGPISREVHELQVNVPKWKSQAESGKGWLGHLAKELHLTSDLKSGTLTKKISASAVAGGVVGAGKVVLSAVSAVAIVSVLTLYFLFVLPSVRALWLRFMPGSRRTRVAALTDEVLSRVGGFVLGNLLTSVVAGIGTWIWLTIFGVPYPMLLALLVALLDLIPMVGSTIAGIVVATVALSVSVPVAVATLAFYIAYRFFEDYLLTPRVMRHTVRISPGLTIVATLIGGVLLGLIGALIAIPVAAGVHLVLEEVTFPSLERR